jgi:hypothetical protein
MISLSEQDLSTDQYLTHYWPISNGEMKDVVDRKDMTQGNATYFTLDRFGNKNSALALNGSWTHVPPGIYFDTQEFTLSVWVYPQQVGYLSRVIDFGNSLTASGLENILLRLDSGLNNKPALNIINGARNSIGDCMSNKALLNGKWQFLTVTFNKSLESIYLNGTLTCQKIISSYILPKITRLYNYFGKSHNPSHGYSRSFIDDLRFYNKSLNQCEIFELMDRNETSGNFNYF